MVVQSALAVVGVQLRLQRLVALDDVQHVAQHFEHHAVGGGAHSGRARIQIHAGHFAKQIAWAECRDGIVVRQIDRGIDGNAGARSFFFATLLAASSQAAGQPAQKSARAALRLHVRHGRREKHLGLAFENVERSGSVFAFAADDLALLEMTAHHCVLVELQKSSRDFLEICELLQLVDIHRLARQHRLYDAFVGERAGGARDHAFAAGDAGRIAHRQVVVERDAGPEAFAAPARTLLWRISSQPRMQRSHRMQAS